MSEQTTKPTKEKKETTKKTNPNSMVWSSDSEPKKKPAGTAKKKKETITNLNMQVDIPGELKTRKTEKAPTPKTSEKKAPASKPADKKAPSPKPAVKKQSPTPKKSDKAKPPVKKTSLPKKTSAPRPGSKGKTPARKKSGSRKKIVPPKIGSRRGYRSLVLRLRAPVFIITCMVGVLVLFLTYCKAAGPVGRYVTSALSPALVELTIEPGMSAKAVSLLLKAEGVVDDDRALLQFFIDGNYATSLRSGTFVMEKGMDPGPIARLLTEKAGELVILVRPASTLASIDSYLERRGYAKGDEFLKAAETLQHEHSLSFAEGWLLSGEYVIPTEGSAAALAQAMFSSMLEAVQPHLESEQIALWGLEQTLIIASMIQAETQDVEEMPLIASVIYNRLKAGEPLGIDATTRYELDDWKNPIPKKALENQTPYNTRRKVGLPPSGICSPSKAAVDAALFPLESPYFYYLHGSDRRLYPAKTYDEHKQNIKAYL